MVEVVDEAWVKVSLCPAVSCPKLCDLPSSEASIGNYRIFETLRSSERESGRVDDGHEQKFAREKFRGERRERKAKDNGCG